MENWARRSSHIRDLKPGDPHESSRAVLLRALGCTIACGLLAGGLSDVAKAKRMQGQVSAQGVVQLGPLPSVAWFLLQTKVSCGNDKPDRHGHRRD